MKQMKPILVIAGAVAAAVFFTSDASVRGQGRDRDWFQQFPVLEGPGSRIGVTARDLEAAELERLKVAGGVFLETVTPDSPAAGAGLRAQDVVVEFDGERVRSLRQFTRLVRETPASRPVRAAVMRDGKRTELTVTPTGGGYAGFGIDADRVRREIEDFSTRIPFEFPDPAARSRLGVTVQELSPELAAYFGAADGVLVSSVVADSPASRSGIKPGDVITTVDGRSIASSGELVRELRTASTDGEVTLGIVRDKKATTVSAKVETPAERRPARQARPIRTPV